LVYAVQPKRKRLASIHPIREAKGKKKQQEKMLTDKDTVMYVYEVQDPDEK
jgi:hypothetical protein